MEMVLRVSRVLLRVTLGLVAVLSASCAREVSQRPVAAIDGRVVPVDPSFFIPEALVGEVVKEQRALADGTTVLAYVIRTYSEPHEHQMGPWSPRTISDGADAGGIWFHDGKVYDVDGQFVKNIAEFYADPAWKLYRDDGTVRVTDTKEAFEAAARPDVDPKYNNYVVEGRPEWVDRKVNEYVIPVQPVYQEKPSFFGRPQGGPERGARRPDGPAPRNGEGGPPARAAAAADGGRPAGPGGRDAGDPRRGQAGQVVLAIAFNGVKFDPPAPVDAILGAHTLAPFDDAGGHLNPHEGYHYHAATGKTKEIAQSDGHAAMIGYALDGFGLYAQLDTKGQPPADLDECGGHFDAVRGYHYHAGAPGSNQIIKAFRGKPGTITVVQ